MMKQVLRSLPCALLLAAVVFIAACSKDGAQGPAGAPGPAGNPGTTGPAGPKGDSGKPGSANVIYSAWLDVTYQPQTVTTNGVLDTVAFTAAIPAPKLDSVSLNNALIQVYINLGTPAVARVVVLPYTDENFTIIRYVAGVKSISLISNTNPSTATTASGKRFQYRYVIIPGGVAARAAGIDWKNYGQVQQYLQLQD